MEFIEKVEEQTSEPPARFDVPQRLADSLKKVFSALGKQSENPYEIRCETEETVNSIKEDINGLQNDVGSIDEFVSAIAQTPVTNWLKLRYQGKTIYLTGAR